MRRRSVQFDGLVGLARRVRLAWARPAARAQAMALVRGELARVQAVLADAGLRPAHLSAPSQRALAFLETLARWSLGESYVLGADLEGPRPANARPTRVARPRAAAFLAAPVTLAGLSRDVHHLLDELAAAIATNQPPPDERRAALLASRLHVRMRDTHLQVADLTTACQELFGLVCHLATPGGWEQLVDATRRAHAAIAPQLPRLGRAVAPLLVRLLPCHVVYRWRVSAVPPAARAVLAGAGTPSAKATVLDLPAAMMCFSADDFALLARRMAGDGAARQPLALRQESPAYRAMLQALAAHDSDPGCADAAGGDSPSPATAGVAHDLDASFARVNAAYFAGQMARPRLEWSRTLTGRKFGHYDPIHDTVMLSATLDAPGVPAFVVDHVMHHELLHKELGATWTAETRRYHTTEFRRRERGFARYAEAEAWLRRLARSVHGLG